ncbi:hypothetical protein [Marinobacter sp.]|uniref:hypothetical protein n=1 Tax=Marinobacter sp. TaxID=50741 RepID=UPI003A9520AF
MATENIIFALILSGCIISGILYVAFGQITVRKLRKNPKVRDQLGIEYASGWDIINVAQAFAFPRNWTRKVENSRFSFIHANATLLYENTKKYDQILGCIFYWLLTASGLSMILLVLANYLGAFN